MVKGAWRKWVRRGSPMLEFTWKLRNVKNDLKRWAKREVRTDEELREGLQVLEGYKRELY